MRRSSTRHALVILTLLAAACRGHKEDQQQDQAVRTDSAGIQIVRNTAATHAIGWTFALAHTIRGAAQDTFVRVRDNTVAVGPDGRIYVLDTGRTQVMIYDSTGTLIKTVGGQGTGVFNVASQLSNDPDGGFDVLDIGVRTLLRFDADGNRVAKLDLPVDYEGGPLRLAAGNTFVYQEKVKSSKGEPLMQITREGVNARPHPLIAALLDEDVVANFPECGVAMAVSKAFSAPPPWTVLGDVIAVAETPTYAVRMYRDTAETRRVRRDVKPERANGQYAILAAGNGKHVDLPNGTRCTIPRERIAAVGGYREWIPTIRDVVFTPDSGMWVMREDPGYELAAIDVFDSRGEYLGSLPRQTPWPVGFLPDGSVVTVDVDAGRDVVQVYHVNKTGPS